MSGVLGDRDRLDVVTALRRWPTSSVPVAGIPRVGGNRSHQKVTGIPVQEWIPMDSRG